VVTHLVPEETRLHDESIERLLERGWQTNITQAVVKGTYASYFTEIAKSLIIDASKARGS